MKVKVTERSALVQVAASTQQLTSHAGLVLVRELAGRLGIAELLDRVTVKKRKRGYSPAQAILGLCETLIVGGECLDDIAFLRGDSAQEGGSVVACGDHARHAEVLRLLGDAS